MNKLTPTEVAEARGELGSMWRLGRPLSHAELAACLGLSGADKARDMERDDRASRITGPVSVAIRAMLCGYVPPNAPRR